MRSFGSDNNSGVHPAVMEAIVAANNNHAVGYGDDPWTLAAEACLRAEFGPEATPFFVFNGTGANVIALRACTQSFHAIIAAESAHIACDECGAPTQFTGCMIKEIVTTDGKLTPELIQSKLTGFGSPHHAQPRVVYISQCTEFGTLYTPDEIRAIADFVHQHALYLHMDGARLYNAAARLGTTLKELTVDCGVDILSLGGTKNGLMMGEVVLSFRPELSQYIAYFRKQSAQLYSKMRFASAQFPPFFEGELWRKSAHHANAMAQLLVKGLIELGISEFSQPVEANIILVKLPKEVTNALLARHFFYIWNEESGEVRFVTSWDTTTTDLDCFLNDLRHAIQITTK